MTQERDLDDLENFVDQVDRHGNVGTRDRRGAKAGSSGIKTMQRHGKSFRAKLKQVQAAQLTKGKKGKS